MAEDMKEVIKRIIVEFHEEGLPKDLIEREIDIKKYLVKGHAKVIVGPRRAGKTYLMFQIMKTLGKEIENYIYIDFEDNRLIGFNHQNFEEILEAYFSLYPDRKPILFLDEIHNVDGWEYFVRRLVNKGYEVFITGSNSKLLSREYSTKLGGRYVEMQVLPLSFREFLLFKGIKPYKRMAYSTQRFKMIKLFDEYLKYGGFPTVVKEKSKELLLKSYYDTVVFGDVVARNHVEEEKVLEVLIKKIAENITNPYSFNSLVKKMKSLNIETNVKLLSTYYKYLEDAFFVLTSTIERDSVLRRERERKSYLIDNGYLSLFYVKENKEKLLENLVAIELFRRGEKLRYFRNSHEVDFAGKVPIQVCYSLNDENKEREVKALLSYMEERGRKKGYIITYEQRGEIKKGSKTIHIVPFWYFSLFSLR